MKGVQEGGLEGYAAPLGDRSYRPSFPLPSGYPAVDTAGRSLEHRGAGRDPSMNRNPRPRFRNWDIVLTTAPDNPGHPKFQLYRPLIFPADFLADVGASPCTVTFDSDGFLPAASQWVVAESTAAPWTTFTIKMLSTWTGHPSAYQFSASHELEAVRLPLWRFFGTDSTTPGGRYILGTTDSPVYGEKLVPDAPLQLAFGLFNVPSTIHYRTVPYFV